MKRTALKKWGRAAIRKRTKYGNTPRTYDGVEYHSRKEADYAQRLDTMTLAGKIRSWRRQVSIKLEVNGWLICRYIVDFVVIHLDGHEEYIEVKGFETPEWRIKEKLFRAIYPDRLLTVVR